MAKKSYILIFAILLIGGAIFLLESRKTDRAGESQVVTVTPRVDDLPLEQAINDSSNQPSEAVQSQKSQEVKFLTPQEKAKSYELAKEITTPDGFINTGNKPITIEEFVGKKVVLIDFWTYSCINCQRTTPYLNSWYEKYKDRGLVMIGIHTPEFEFEKKYENVKQAVDKFGIKFPVVLDNDYSTWNAYLNRYWPRKYLIDIDGYIVYDHIGEGAYEETETKIQELLLERTKVLGESVDLDIALTQDAPQKVGGAQSQETYFGALRNEFLGNGMRGVSGMQKFIEPSKILDNLLYLVGTWYIDNEFARNESLAAKIIFRYTAKDVFLVAEGDGEVTVKVLLDGQPLGEERGGDVVYDPNGNSIVKVREARLYKIVQDKGHETHTLEFIIENPGLKAFTFTFG